MVSTDSWEDSGESWKSEYPFISFIIGNNYKFLKPRIIVCMRVKSMEGLVPLIDLDCSQVEKKFSKCQFLGLSSECDWLSEKLVSSNEIKIKECNWAIFVGRPEGEEDLFVFFVISAKDNNGHPLFWDDFDI